MIGDTNVKGGLIKNDKGLFVEPDFLMEKNANEKMKIEENNIERHNQERRKEIMAPIPGVKVPFSFVMTKAVRPKLINALAHMNLIKLDIEGDEKFKADAKHMVRVVSNEQEIVSVGKNAEENFSPGQLVKIDFRRFTNIRDTNEATPNGEYSSYIDVPIHNIGGYDYMMIDQRDIVWAYDENHQLADLIGFEDETV